MEAPSTKDFANILSNLDQVKYPNTFFQDLDIKFFSYPYNNWQFLRAMETLHSFKLKDYLNGSIPISKDNLKKINEKSFNEYLRANIFFQHCIYCEGIHDRVEDDILERIESGKILTPNGLLDQMFTRKVTRRELSSSVPFSSLSFCLLRS